MANRDKGVPVECPNPDCDKRLARHSEWARIDCQIVAHGRRSLSVPELRLWKRFARKPEDRLGGSC